MQIYLEAAIQELPGVDQFLRPRTTTKLGLIKFITNLISKISKLAVAMASDDYEALGQSKDTKMVDTQIETRQPGPRDFDIEGIYSPPTLPPIVKARSFIGKSVPSDYVVMSQSVLTKIMTRLSTVEKKVLLME
ncbi:hypothetical protein FXO37_01992 [Capsicum annuum]|nr:hypothetical protein FXO37_01992 [Capsicum annuum]